MSYLAVPLLLITTALAPVQAPATAQDQAHVIRSTSHLVQVSLVVRDKRGAPVTDLRQEDFVVRDNGQKQVVRYFAVETGQPRREQTLLPANVVSNRFANSSSDGQEQLVAFPNSLTAILLDGLNTTFLDQQSAKAGLLKLLQQVQPNDQIAIYTLAGKLTVLHDFTYDARSLSLAISRHRETESSLMAGSTYADANTVDPHLNAFLDQSSAQLAGMNSQERARRTLAALETIALHMEGLPGRKNLVWVAGDFPVFVGRGLNRAGIAIYPVDARGLMGQFDATPSLSPLERPGPGQVRGAAPADQRSDNNTLQSQANMRMIADQTGGRAFTNSSDFAGVIRLAIEDAHMNYVLSYSPNHNQWNGKFHEIKVSLNRPGLEVHYRKGYYATPEDSGDALRQETLATAAASPLQSTGLNMLVKMIQAPSVPNPQAKVRLVLDPRELSFSQSGKGLREASVDLLTLVKDDQGNSLGERVRTMHFALKPDRYLQMLESGIIINLDFDAPAKSYRARLVVRDLTSGVTGSVDVPFQH